MHPFLLPFRYGVIGLFLVLGLAGTAMPADAQHIRVRTIDDSTSVPIPSTVISLLDTTDVAVAIDTTDAGGFATLAVPYNGRYALDIRAEGYEAVRTQFFPLRSHETLGQEMRLKREGRREARLFLPENARVNWSTAVGLPVFRPEGPVHLRREP